MESVNLSGHTESVSRRQAPSKVFIDIRIIETAAGRLTLAASEKSLLAVMWNRDMRGDAGNAENPILCETEAQIREYLAGRRKVFSLPLEMVGTEFQVRCWKELMKIPYGEYISYKEQAERLGTPSAVRAVGAANGQNRLGIIVPCHRVVASSGALTGFAGGIDVKRRLLTLEGLAPTEWGFRKQLEFSSK